MIICNKNSHDLNNISNYIGSDPGIHTGPYVTWHLY